MTQGSPRRIFVSDLHLTDSADGRFAGFAALLQRESGWADEIVILGDLFEAWVGDDDDSALAEATLAALRTAASQVRLWFLPGNRDFLCGQRFARRSGVRLLPEVHRTDDGLLLAHGDALCTADQDYQRMRTLVRSRRWQQDVLSKPLAERQRLAESLRAASVEHQSNRPEAITDVSPEAAAQLCGTHESNVLIHGHTHRPGVHRDGGLTRYVLGDWARCAWVLRQLGARMRLECWPLPGEPSIDPDEDERGAPMRTSARGATGP